MGVAFELEVARSRLAARVAVVSALLPAAALLIVGARIAGGPTLPLDGSTPTLRALSAGAALAGAAALAWSAARARRAPAQGVPIGTLLRVDAHGAAALGAGGARSAPVPVVPRGWWSRAGLTLLVLAPYGRSGAHGAPARPITVVLGRDAMTDEAWRRLQVWLRWLERGRHDRPHPGPDPT